MSNQLKVKVVSSKVILPDSLGGIDTTNLLGTNPSFPYTATQDCYVYLSVNGGGGTITIDGSDVSCYSFDSRTYTGFTNLLKKGQVMNQTSGASCKIYGIKY